MMTRFNRTRKAKGTNKSGVMTFPPIQSILAFILSFMNYAANVWQASTQVEGLHRQL